MLKSYFSFNLGILAGLTSAKNPCLHIIEKISSSVVFPAPFVASIPKKKELLK